MRKKHFDEELDELLKRIYQLKKKAIANLKKDSPEYKKLVEDNKEEIDGDNEQPTI